MSFVIYKNEGKQSWKEKCNKYCTKNEVFH